MDETFQKFSKRQDPTQPAFYLEKNHWSQYNILINLKTSSYSIFICANYRVGDRDSPLSTLKDCLHLSNKKLRSTEFGMCWLWFLYFLQKWAEPMFISPLPPLTTPLFPSFFSRQSQCSSACVVWQAGPCLNWARLVKYCTLQPVFQQGENRGGRKLNLSAQRLELLAISAKLGILWTVAKVEI